MRLEAPVDAELTPDWSCILCGAPDPFVPATAGMLSDGEDSEVLMKCNVCSGLYVVEVAFCARALREGEVATFGP